MKNILLTLMVFGIVGCAVEEDTRLICDCDYVEEYLKPNQKCTRSNSYEDNNSLVFNISKKKFMFNGIDISIAPEQFVTFDESKITYIFNTPLEKKLKSFDRVNLVYEETTQFYRDRIEVEGKNMTVFDNPVSAFYQCRVVAGV